MNATPLICKRCGGTAEALPRAAGLDSLLSAGPCRCSHSRRTTYYAGPCTPVVRWATGAWEGEDLLDAIDMAKALVRSRAAREATVTRSEDGELLFTCRRPE